jgi:hypothetical protein
MSAARGHILSMYYCARPSARLLEILHSPRAVGEEVLDHAKLCYAVLLFYHTAKSSNWNTHLK